MNTAALILIGSFVVLLLLNVPIAVCLGMSSIFTFIHFQSGCGEVAPCERSEGVCPAEIAGRKRDIAAGE